MRPGSVSKHFPGRQQFGMYWECNVNKEKGNCYSLSSSYDSGLILKNIFCERLGLCPFLQKGNEIQRNPNNLSSAKQLVS